MLQKDFFPLSIFSLPFCNVCLVLPPARTQTPNKNEKHHAATSPRKTTRLKALSQKSMVSKNNKGQKWTYPKTRPTRATAKGLQSPVQCRVVCCLCKFPERGAGGPACRSPMSLLWVLAREPTIFSDLGLRGSLLRNTGGVAAVR